MHMLLRQQCLFATKFLETFTGLLRRQLLFFRGRILTEGGEADWTDDLPVVNAFGEAFIRAHYLVCGRGPSGET